MLISDFSLLDWYMLLQAGSIFFGGITLTLVMYKGGMAFSLFLQLIKDFYKKEEFTILALLLLLLVFCALVPCLGYIFFVKELRGKLE